MQNVFLILYRLLTHIIEFLGHESVPAEALLPRCSVGEPESKGEKRRFSAIESDSEIEESYSEASTASTESKLLKPAYLLAQWIEPRTLQKRLTLSVQLPAGTEAGMFKCRVDPNNRKVFEVSVVWPKPLVDVEVMHRKWLTSTGPDRIQAYHPKILAFQAALKELRRKCGDDVVSTAKIPLPFAVETYVYEKYNLAWRDNSTKIIYVELKAAMDSYAHLNDEQDFEVV